MREFILSMLVGISCNPREKVSWAQKGLEPGVGKPLGIFSQLSLLLLSASISLFSLRTSFLYFPHPHARI